MFKWVLVVGYIIFLVLEMVLSAPYLTGATGDTSPPELLTKTPPSCGTYPPTPCPYWEPTPLPYGVYEPVLLNGYP